MRAFNADERAYIELRKEIQRQDAEEASRMASRQLWKDVSTEDWCKDAAMAQKRCEDHRRAAELEGRRRWQRRCAEAVAESFIELDI